MKPYGKIVAATLVFALITEPVSMAYAEDFSMDEEVSVISEEYLEKASFEDDPYSTKSEETKASEECISQGTGLTETQYEPETKDAAETAGISDEVMSDESQNSKVVIEAPLAADDFNIIESPEEIPAAAGAGDMGTLVSNFDLFSYEIKEETVTIIKYIGTETIVEIPEKIDDYPVTEILEKAFAEAGVTEVTLPKTLICIGQEAFAGNSALKRLQIPESVREIGTDAFRSCENLVLVGYAGSYAENYAKDHYLPFEAAKKDEEVPISLDTCSISLKDEMVYTGKPLDQEITVTSPSGQILENGKDYTVENLNNTEVGTGTIKITGIGTYTGALEKNYKIVLDTVKVSSIKSKAYNKLKISWKKVAGATGYYVYVRSGNTWKRIGNTDKTSFVHTSSKKFPLKTGITYTYTVKAYRTSGTTTYTGGYDKNGIQGKSVPNTPKITNVECTGEGKIRIRWKKTSGATHYIVMRKKADGNWKKVATIKGENRIEYVHMSSAKFPIKKGKTYTYTVRSYNSNGKTYGGYNKNGVQVKALTNGQAEVMKAITNAEKIVSQITNSKMSKSEKMLACFRWVISKPYTNRRTFARIDGWTGYYANDHFVYGRGDCHSDACAFAYLAKALGYTNVYVCTDTAGTKDAHSWAEVDGLVYDPLFAEAKSFSRNYGVSYRTYILSAITRQKI